MSAMAYQIIGVSIVFSTVCSGADQRKHQSSAQLAFGREFPGNRWIPRPKASNAENVSIWRCHHGVWCGHNSRFRNSQFNSSSAALRRHRSQRLNIRLIIDLNCRGMWKIKYIVHISLSQLLSICFRESELPQSWWLTTLLFLCLVVV